MRSTVSGDAFGAALLDAAAGNRGLHFVERDDGLIEAMDASSYFAKQFHWPDAEARAIKGISGRVLDVGAGAGRHSLVLQNRGCDVVALDVSSGAIQVCQQRGVHHTFLGTVFDLLDTAPEPFDALILMGNNLALLQSLAKAKGMFDAMRELLRPNGVVVGTCLDPYLTDDPDHLAYHESNRAAGRPPGQIRMRFRHRRIATEWFSILFLSPNELAELAARSGWEVIEVTEPDPTYLAVLRPV